MGVSITKSATCSDRVASQPIDTNYLYSVYTIPGAGYRAVPRTADILVTSANDNWRLCNRRGICVCVCLLLGLLQK